MGMVEGYEVREPTLDDIPDFFQIMQNSPEVNLPAALLRACVYRDGVRLGAAVSALPIRLVMALTNECIAVTGIGGANQGNG